MSTSEQQHSTDFSKSELTRYSRHLILPEVGREGQQKIKNAKVLIVGAGGLGCPGSLYLAAAGVGTIGLIDFDNVDLSNLQRQVIYHVSDVGKSKANTASERLSELNDQIGIHASTERLSAANALDLISQYDVIIDGTDNFSTRYLINDACVLLKKPNVHGSIYRFEGQVTVFSAFGGPCYRCLFPKVPPPDAVPNCAEGGVLGVLAGTIGILQATETLKLILGIGEPLIGRLMIYDALDMRFDTLMIKRNRDCPVCGEKPSIQSLIEENFVCAAQPPATASGQAAEITATELDELLKHKRAQILLIDVRTPQEFALCAISEAMSIPLNDIEISLQDLDANKDIVVYCKSGIRSAKAAGILRSKGFHRVRSLHGGIAEWAKEIDPSIDVY